MQLTAEQIQAVRSGSPVEVDDPEVGEPCVVMRADRFAATYMVTDEPLSNLEVGELIERTMREYDADDPGLALYQEMVR
ncbi:MAG: hypothetical protein H7062_02200 [Candidatus Saccharimonas sp.]|nr:hypothetical protein [Planctomycetaceae bacterium]